MQCDIDFVAQQPDFSTAAGLACDHSELATTLHCEHQHTEDSRIMSSSVKLTCSNVLEQQMQKTASRACPAQNLSDKQKHEILFHKLNLPTRP